MSQPKTFFCISFYFKGEEFLRACKQAGNTVYLLTKESLRDEPWPREAIDEFFFMPEDNNSPENLHAIALGFAWLFRTRKIDRIVALDDFDVEKGAYLREEFRIPGMGQTTARYFRDKLAMRERAADQGIPVPAFSTLFNNEQVNHFADTVSPPWLVKPRSEASATGIKKVHNKEELWEVINKLGDDRYRYLVEQFKPGDVYHADALTVDGKVLFCRISRYLNTPFEVAHGGGIFRSATVPFGSDDDKALQALNARVMDAFGMLFSASHTEFIKSHETGQFYFLETSSRVGGAHLADMVQISSDINLWREWARIESAMAKGEKYELPPVKNEYTGIIISLSRQEHPDQSQFNDPEVKWRIQKKNHVGVIVSSDNHDRIMQLLEDYMGRVYRDYHASAPPPDRPLH